MGAVCLFGALDTKMLESFAKNALQAYADLEETYDNTARIAVGDIFCSVHEKRFEEVKTIQFEESNPMVTMVVVSMQEEDLSKMEEEDLRKMEEEDLRKMEEEDSSLCETGARWKLMQQLGANMWQFLVESFPRFEGSQNINAVLTCTNKPMMVLLLGNGIKVFMTAKCWDESVTSQDGCEWIHASMYSLAFGPSGQLPLSKVSESSTWDIDMGSEARELVRGMELAFAMGTHERLGEQSLILKVFTVDMMFFLHELCLKTRWKNVSHEGATLIIDSECWKEPSAVHGMMTDS
jgi:hypothetical protein